MKIAISGSAGIGKSTLAGALAGELGCALVDEGYDSLFDGHSRFITPRSRLRGALLSLLEFKTACEDAAAACIADRCAADLFNLWLSQGFGADQRLTAALYNRCRVCVSRYDTIVVLPWGALPLVQTEARVSRRRSLNTWTQLFNHATIIGLLQQWVEPERLLPVPFSITGLSERVAFVRERVRAKPVRAATPG